MKLVSIIIPVYNSEKTIFKTIMSCLEQSYREFELIIIDDGSTDNSANIILNFKDERIKYFYIENSGRSTARNKGLELSKGDYIQFLDSDDTLDKIKLEKAVNVLNNDLTIDAIQCGTNYYKNNEIILKKDAKAYNSLNSTLLRKNIFPINSVIFKKKHAANFLTDLSYCEDWYFWFETLFDKKIYFDQEYFGANVFIHDSNTMSNYKMMLWGELYVLFLIKKNKKHKSFRRDLYLIKQYINYSLKFDNSDITIYSDIRLFKKINELLNITIINKTIYIYIKVKKSISKKTLY